MASLPTLKGLGWGVGVVDVMDRLVVDSRCCLTVCHRGSSRMLSRFCFSIDRLSRRVGGAFEVGANISSVVRLS